MKAWSRHSFHATALALDKDTVQTNVFFAELIVPAVTILPLWWRFLQNLQRSYDTRERWPHLGNAMKYVTAQTVGLYGLYHPDARQNPLWIFGFVFATMYQFTWDIFMDWDMVRIKGGTVKMRETLLYKSPTFYICIACINLVLRFFWTLTLLPEGGAEAWQQNIQVRLSPILAGAEICRRCMWGFLRLENEHLHVYGTAIDETFDGMETSKMEPMKMGGGGGGSGGSSGGREQEPACLDLGFIRIQSSTKHLSNQEVLNELTALAVFVAGVALLTMFII